VNLNKNLSYNIILS